MPINIRKSAGLRGGQQRSADRDCCRAAKDCAGQKNPERRTAAVRCKAVGDHRGGGRGERRLADADDAARPEQRPEIRRQAAEQGAKGPKARTPYDQIPSVSAVRKTSEDRKSKRLNRKSTRLNSSH